MSKPVHISQALGIGRYAIAVEDQRADRGNTRVVARRVATKRLARSFAAREVEGSILPLARLAATNRQRAADRVAERQYVWAGYFRRVAEIQESRLRP